LPRRRGWASSSSRPSYLEAAATVDAVVFDKTGTITTGKFQVSKLAPATGVEGAELLKAAANGEQHSNHPLALSILRPRRPPASHRRGDNDYEEIHGRGRPGPHQRWARSTWAARRGSSS
jgi:cation transport ATPase